MFTAGKSVTIYISVIHRVEAVVPTEESKILQELKLITDTQWLKIHGKNLKKNTKTGSSKIKEVL